MNTRDDIDSEVCDIMMEHGPDGHVDGHDVLTDMVVRRIAEATEARGVSALHQLLTRCKCGVYLTVNEHRDYYETPAERLDWYARLECPPHIDADVRAGILATGNIVDLQFYPYAPTGSHHLVHYDLDEVLRLALDLVAKGPA